MSNTRTNGERNDYIECSQYLTNDTYPMKEWLAWRAVCMQLRRRGIDPNDPENDILIRTIRHYAATYHALYFPEHFHHQHELDEQTVKPLIDELR